jgi:hypothetical protein
MPPLMVRKRRTGVSGNRTFPVFLLLAGCVDRKGQDCHACERRKPQQLGQIPS